MNNTPFFGYRFFLLCFHLMLAGCQEQVTSESPGFDVVYGDPSRRALGFDPNPWRAREVLDPTTYASSDGTWRFTQTPLQREGTGPGIGKLEHLDAVVWENDFPLTFEHVVLSDAGQSVACGRAGEFQVWIIDPRGDRRIVQRIQTTGSNFLHTPDNPLIAGLFLHEDADRFVVRVADPDVNTSVEEWLVYSLSSGEPLARFRPKELASDPEALRFMIDARPLRSTPLVLVQWYRYRDEELGTRFAVLDEEGKEIWSLDLPNDFESPEGGRDWGRLDRLRSTGTIMSVSTPSRFEIEIARKQQRVTFSIERNTLVENAWTISEIGRSPHTAVPSQPSEAAIQEVELELIETAELKAGDLNSGPVHSIAAFGFSTASEVEFVRKSSGERYEIVLLDHSGALQRKVSVTGVPVDVMGTKHWCKISPEHWILIVAPWGGETPSTMAWSINSISGESNRFPEFDCPAVEGVAPDGAGGFVITSSYIANFTGYATLRAFDSSGRLRWRIGDRDHDERLRSPEDVAVTSSGAVVVLENISNRLQVFDLAGTLTNTISLSNAWGHARYPTEVIADGRGDVIVLDYGGGQTLWRTSLDSGEATSFRARYADGRTSRRLPERLQVAPDGSLWTTDGHVLLRLDEKGTEIERFGRSAASDDLVEPRGATIDDKDRICVLDAATNAVHVFNAKGRRLFIGRPSPGDFADLGLNGMTTDTVGSLFVETDSSDFPGTYLGFDSEGKRIGKTQLGHGTTHFVPGTDNRWTQSDSSELRLLDSDLKQLRSIKKLSDGRWFHYMVDFSVAPDGSLAVLDWEDTNGDGRRVNLATYGPDGAPRRTYELPRGVAYYGLEHGGKWLACLGGETILFVHEESGALRRFRVVQEGGRAAFGIGFLKTAQEFCVVDLGSRQVRRYAMPSE